MSLRGNVLEVTFKLKGVSESEYTSVFLNLAQMNLEEKFHQGPNNFLPCPPSLTTVITPIRYVNLKRTN